MLKSDIINWRDYNFIIDRLLEYEDNNYKVMCVCCVMIDVDSSTTQYNNLIYRFVNDDCPEEYPKEKLLDKEYKGFNKYGLFYRIICRDEKNKVVPHFYNEFMNKINSRFNKFSFDGTELVVKPKVS